MALSGPPCFSARLDWIDWLVLAAYLGATTILGARLAGRQATIRDFFLGGRKLPWWAVCGSIIATEISAVTFVAVPTISFAPGGDLAYLQLAIGAIVARIIVGYYFVPRYYEREIYSPYDYMGDRLGPRVKNATTGLFFVGAILGQGARLYVSAFVVSMITGLDLVSSIWVMGAVSVFWTWLGGITTVVWTDVVQFVVMTAGAVTMLCYSVASVPGSLPELMDAAAGAGKFNCLNTSTDLALPYTLWCGLLATPFLNLAAFGTDQVMAQRMFCCRGPREARKAVIISSVGIGIAVLMLYVGIALFCYFRRYPFTPQEADLYEAQNTYLVPIFIVRAMPAGMRGLIVAAVLASAISTLDSTLAALAQATIGLLRTTPRLPRRSPADAEPQSPTLGGAKQADPTTPAASTNGRAASGSPRRWLPKALASDIALSKLLMLLWGIALCLMATACIAIADQYANAVDLALALVGYTYGPLLAIFLLAFFPLRRDDAGLAWAIPLAMLAVFGMSQHDLDVDLPGALPTVDLSNCVVWLGAGLATVWGWVKFRTDGRRLATVATAAAVVVLLHHYQVGVDPQGRPTYLAFTWSYPVGAIITFAIACILGRPAHRLRVPLALGPS